MTGPLQAKTLRQAPCGAGAGHPGRPPGPFRGVSRQRGGCPSLCPGLRCAGEAPRGPGGGHRPVDHGLRPKNQLEGQLREGAGGDARDRGPQPAAGPEALPDPAGEVRGGGEGFRGEAGAGIPHPLVRVRARLEGSHHLPEGSCGARGEDLEGRSDQGAHPSGGVEEAPLPEGTGALGQTHPADPEAVPGGIRGAAGGGEDDPEGEGGPWLPSRGAGRSGSGEVPPGVFRKDGHHHGSRGEGFPRPPVGRGVCGEGRGRRGLQVAQRPTCDVGEAVLGVA